MQLALCICVPKLTKSSRPQNISDDTYKSVVDCAEQCSAANTYAHKFHMLLAVLSLLLDAGDPKLPTNSDERLLHKHLTTCSHTAIEAKMRMRTLKMYICVYTYNIVCACVCHPFHYCYLITFFGFTMSKQTCPSHIKIILTNHSIHIIYMPLYVCMYVCVCGFACLRLSTHW